MIGVHSAKFPAEQDPANLQAAIQRHELTHPVVADPEMEIWQGYAVRAWPTLMFVDPAGRVYGKHEGEFPLEPVRLLLREMIAEFGAEGGIDRTPLTLEPLAAGGGALRFPGNVLADAAGGRLFVADTGHNRIVVASLDGRVQQVAGDGEAGLVDGGPEVARFDHPRGMALDPTGGVLYVADTENHAIRTIELATGEVRTVAGTGEQGDYRGGGPARETVLSSPWDVAYHDGALWIAMAGSHQLWTYDPVAETARPAAGTGAESIHDGPLAEATFAQPSGITALDGLLYVADSESSAVRRVDPGTDRVRRLVGRGLFDFGDLDGKGDGVRLQHPLGVCAVRERGEPVVYVADTYNDKIKRLDPRSRAVETRFGGEAHGHAAGAGRAAAFWQPGGLGVAGRRCFVADTNNHAIRRIDLDGGTVETVELVGL
ncbi:MAG: alkyl hydroperoxide reductase [Thermomicrobiales bacterium]